MIKSEIICDDILQDIFVSLWDRRGQLEISNLKAYLYRATKLQCLNCLQRENRLEQFTERAISGQRDNSVEDWIGYMELNEAVRGSVEKLPIKCREVYELSRNQELSNAEIAGKLGLSIQTVKNQLSKALKQIRLSLDHVTILLPLVIVVL